MKYLLTICSVLVCFALSAQQQTKLSPLTQIFLRQTANSKALPNGYVYKTGPNGQQYISALALMDNNSGASEQMLDLLGVKVGTKAGKVWTLQIPIEKVQNMTNVQGIAYLQLDEPIHPNMDSARKATRVDSVQAGLGGLPQAYWGDGVVVGVIDAGFDYRHPSLFDTSGTVYRVKKIWEQLGTGTPPSGFAYGSEMTNPSDMWTKGYDIMGSHGAHVAGIAAGSGHGSDNPDNFRGMAPQSDLVMVGITPSPENWTSTGMTDIIDGMNYVYTYAASVGKPAVVNLSWGCSIGPHDGLSLFSQACDALTGPGKLFVCSAGNNGDMRLHVQKNFTATDSMVHTFVGFDDALPEQKTWVDIWGDSSKEFCIRLGLYSGFTRIDSTAWTCLDNQTHDYFMIGSNGDTAFVTIVTSDNEFNGKPRVFIYLHSKVNDPILISVKSTSGRVDMWNGIVVDTRGYYGHFTNNNMGWVISGNSNITIGDMASTRSALAVGAYASRNIYTNVSGGVVDYSFYADAGGIVPFSSKGPTRDGRVKPDINAPGLVLGSAINSYDSSFMSAGDSYGSVVHQWNDPNNGRQYSYAMLMGTSMSSPAAAGIAALMLQAAPSLTPQQLKDIVSTTAIKDTKTGNIPVGGNNTWGAGKMNAMRAVNQAWMLTGVEYVQPNKNLFVVYPNPAREQIRLSFITQRVGETVVLVTDILGREQVTLRTQAGIGSNELVIPVAGWSRGVYLVTLYISGQYEMQRIIVE